MRWNWKSLWVGIWIALGLGLVHGQVNESELNIHIQNARNQLKAESPALSEAELDRWATRLGSSNYFTYAVANAIQSR